MNTYEIANPSDACSLLAADFKTAAAAILILGEGAYGAEGPDGVLPVLLFVGNEAAEGWLADTFGDFGAFVASHRTAIADALDSVMLGRDRVAFDEAMARLPEGDREGYRTAVREARRSSMTNIAARAWALAAAHRKLATPEVRG